MGLTALLPAAVAICDWLPHWAAYSVRDKENFKKKTKKNFAALPGTIFFLVPSS
jgi:hypothetical protein